MPKYTSLTLVLLLTLGLSQLSYQVPCTTTGCDSCVNNVCTSCNGSMKYFPNLNSAGSCDLCPSGCDACVRNDNLLICTKCSNAKQYPKSGTTTCENCPEGCDGCQSINGKASCLKCQGGYSRKSEGLVLECHKGMQWWAWLLIILAIVIVLIGIIVGIIMANQKKPVSQKDPYGNNIEMAKNNNGYNQNQSMDQSMIQGNNQNNNNGFNQNQDSFSQNNNNNQSYNNPQQDLNNGYSDAPQNNMNKSNFVDNSPMMSTNNTPYQNNSQMQPQKFDQYNDRVSQFDPQTPGPQDDIFTDNGTNNQGKYSQVIEAKQFSPPRNNGQNNVGDGAGWGSIQYNSRAGAGGQGAQGNDPNYSPFW